MTGHDVFISYANEDKPIADATCALLERGGVRCWIAPRDVFPGSSYAESIMDAIEGARGLVLVFSENANASPHVEREMERAVSKRLWIIPLRVEDVIPRRAFEYYISSSHWLDALTPPLEQHLERLTEAVRRLLAASDSISKTTAPTAPNPARTSPSAFVAPNPMPKTGLVAGDWTLESFIEAVQHPDDTAFLSRILTHFDSQTQVLGSHSKYWFGKRPKGGIFLFPFRLRHPPFQFGIDSTGRLTIKGAWTGFPKVKNHQGFAELAAMLGQHYGGSTSSVPVAGLDPDALWTLAERTAHAIN